MSSYLLRPTAALFAAVAALLWGVIVAEKQKIHLLSLMPYYDPSPSLLPSWHDGDNIYPAVLLAKDQINNDSTILPNHQLEIVQGKSWCQSGQLTIASFVEYALYNTRSRTIVGVVGPGCSSSSLALSPLTNMSDISLVMVHNSGAEVLEDRTKYRYLLGNLGSSSNYAYAGATLTKGEWNEVAFFFDEFRQFFVHIQEAIVKQLDSNITKHPIPVTNDKIPLDFIRRRGIRVVMTMCPPDLTRRIICLSYNKSMVYSKYQFVHTSHTEEDLAQGVSFAYKGKHYNCSQSVMQKALNKHILLVNSYKTNKTGLLGSPLNIDYATYLKKYQEYRESYNKNERYLGKKSNFSQWSGYFYDSVWSWAKVLDNLTREDPLFLEPYGRFYGNETKAKTIMEQFYRTEFNGVTGFFNFERNTGFTSRTINVTQIHSDTGVSTHWCVDKSSNSTSGVRPIQIPSHFPNRRENPWYSRIVLCAVLAIFIVTVVMQVLTWKYRATPSVKATTLHLLHISYFGVYVMLVGLFVFVLYSAVPLSKKFRGKFCEVLWTWMFPIGLTLSLGPVGMRTWRVYRIFVHYLKPGPLITDKVLLTGVVCLVMVDLLIAGARTVFLLAAPSSCRISDEENPGNSACLSNWVIFVQVSYKAVLLIIITALAILTRDIKKLSFTTNSLRVFVYITAIITALGISLMFLFNTIDFSDPTYVFAVITTTIILLCVAFIGCIFMPPLLPTFKSFFKTTIFHRIAIQTSRPLTIKSSWRHRLSSYSPSSSVYLDP